MTTSPEECIADDYIANLQSIIANLQSIIAKHEADARRRCDRIRARFGPAHADRVWDEVQYDLATVRAALDEAFAMKAAIRMLHPTPPIMLPTPGIRDDLVSCERCFTDRPRGILRCQACGHTRVVTL